MTELAPWQQRFRGLRWPDMPGSDSVAKKINFALWRRGLQAIICDDATESGIRLKGSITGHLPKLRKAEETPKEKTKRKPGPQGLPAHMLKQCNEVEMLSLLKRVKREASKARLTQGEAAILGGFPRNYMSPSCVRKAGKSAKERLERLLEILIQRNNQSSV